MPRLPEFDRTEVLNSALQVFWSDGYEASSISKLLDAMEINRGSLYSSFNDKETLFREVMTTYVKLLSGVFKATLVEIENPLEAISAFYRKVFLEVDDSLRSKGCLLFNTVSELSESNPKLAKEAAGYLRTLRDLLHQRLQQAQQQKLVPETMDIDAQADTLLAMIAGLRVLCKMGSSRTELQKVIEPMLENLSA